MEEKDFVNILWKYFELHANQRMQMMNFYIVIISLFFTGLIALFCADGDMRIYEIMLCIAIIVFTFIFMMFDQRTRSLIKKCEVAIKSVEKKYIDQYGADVMIFTQEELQTQVNKEITYTKIMKLEFSFIIIMALLFLVWIYISWHL